MLLDAMHEPEARPKRASLLQAAKGSEIIFGNIAVSNQNATEMSNRYSDNQWSKARARPAGPRSDAIFRYQAHGEA